MTTSWRSADRPSKERKVRSHRPPKTSRSSWRLPRSTASRSTDRTTDEAVSGGEILPRSLLHDIRIEDTDLFEGGAELLDEVHMFRVDEVGVAGGLVLEDDV